MWIEDERDGWQLVELMRFSVSNYFLGVGIFKEFGGFLPAIVVIRGIPEMRCAILWAYEERTFEH